MTQIRKLSVVLSLLAPIAILLGAASSAWAAPQPFSMVGEARLVAGQLSFPIFPFSGLDADGTTAMYFIDGDAVGNCVAPNCIDVETGGVAPTIYFPAAIFDAPAPVPFRGFPLPSVPSILNITTMIDFQLPASSVASDVKFSGRQTGADKFGWCPGVAGLACTVNHPLRSDPISPFVEYDAQGGNRFGGVMQMLLFAAGGPGSGGNVRRFAANPVPPATVRLTLDPMGGTAFYGGGGTAGATDFNQGVGNKPTLDVILTPLGFFVQTIVNTVSSVPNNQDRTDVDFPWTTGMIQILAPNAVNPAARTVTATGSDTRGSDGSGKLVLVSSGVSIQSLSGAWTPSIQTIKIVTYTPEPATWLAAGVALLGLGVGRTMVRRKKN